MVDIREGDSMLITIVIGAILTGLITIISSFPHVDVVVSSTFDSFLVGIVADMYFVVSVFWPAQVFAEAVLLMIPIELAMFALRLFFGNRFHH